MAYHHCPNKFVSFQHLERVAIWKSICPLPTGRATKVSQYFFERMPKQWVLTMSTNKNASLPSQVPKATEVTVESMHTHDRRSLQFQQRFQEQQCRTSLMIWHYGHLNYKDEKAFRWDPIPQHSMMPLTLENEAKPFSLGCQQPPNTSRW